MMNEKEMILAIDIGTTSCRASLVNPYGEIQDTCSQQFTQHFPQSGWVEQDASEIYLVVAKVIKEILSSTNIKIKAIGITNQRETCLLWDKITKEPIGPAIVWQDRRGFELCEKLKKEGLEPLITKKTGLLLDPYFSASKLHWMLKNLPHAKERAENGELYFGTIDSFILHKFTNNHVTDCSNASRTLLYNIHKEDWDDELLKIFDIPRKLLPEVRSSGSYFGSITLNNENKDVPVLAVMGDQQSALFGQACFSKGFVKTTYGTGCFMLMHTGSAPVQSNNRLLTTIASKIGTAHTDYALEGSIFMGGAIIQWLRDELNILEQASDIDPLAESVPDSGGLILVPAFTGLGAPYWDPLAKGAFFGITRGTTKAHIARAALEAIALQVADLLRAMQQDSKIPIKEMRVDGGACKSDLLMQLQADYLGIPVIRPKITETTVLGVAFLAGLGCSMWRDLNEISSFWKKDKTFIPKISEQERAHKFNQWQKALDATRSYHS